MPDYNSISDKKSFISFLYNHLTAERVKRFEKVLQYRTRHITIAAEDIFHERNASALIRSADCFGIQDVHIIENKHLYKVSTHIAKGADNWVDIHLYHSAEDNTRQCIQALKVQGYRIVASTPGTQFKTPEDLDINQKTAVFLGREKEGITETLLDHADDFIMIPMVGFTQSFNLSVAGALILYPLTSRLRNSGLDWKLREEDKDDLRIRWALKSIRGSEQLLKKYINGHASSNTV